MTPAGVRILYIRGEDGYEGPVLKVGNDGAARSVSKDDVITMAEFDRVYLDASKFNGKASFKFVPVDEQGNNVQGPDAANPVSREVKITEAAPQENSSQSPQTPAPEAGTPPAGRKYLAAFPPKRRHGRIQPHGRREQRHAPTE